MEYSIGTLILTFHRHNCLHKHKLYLILLLVLPLRLVLLGNESQLKSVAEKIKHSLEGSIAVEVVGLDMTEDRESAFEEAVDKAWKIFGKLDAFVHCYSYEGTT